MEFIRRPSVLAAVAAALLALNVVALQADDTSQGRTIADVLEDREAERNGGAPGDGDAPAGSGDDAGGEAAGDGTEGASEDATDDAAGDAQTEGDDVATEDAPADGGEDTGDSDEARGALTAPTTGVYSYASSGSWSLTGGDAPVDRQLPATATGRVTGGGDDWAIELVAGDMYADRFEFTIGPANGLDWDSWELDRDFGGGLQTTSYDCSGDSAYYVNDAAPGRTSQHGCATAQGVSSNGTIEYVGPEDVTLGDGTVVTADRLLYTYTVTGTGVSGEGRLDLWLDPATGLRVREQRAIDTVTTSGDDEFVYAEDVQFLLQSLTAS